MKYYGRPQRSCDGRNKDPFGLFSIYLFIYLFFFFLKNISTSSNRSFLVPFCDNRLNEPSCLRSTPPPALGYASISLGFSRNSFQSIPRLFSPFLILVCRCCAIENEFVSYTCCKQVSFLLGYNKGVFSLSMTVDWALLTTHITYVRRIR